MAEVPPKSGVELDPPVNPIVDTNDEARIANPIVDTIDGTPIPASNEEEVDDCELAPPVNPPIVDTDDNGVELAPPVNPIVDTDDRQGISEGDDIVNNFLSGIDKVFVPAGVAPVNFFTQVAKQLWTSTIQAEKTLAPWSSKASMTLVNFRVL